MAVSWLASIPLRYMHVVVLLLILACHRCRPQPPSEEYSRTNATYHSLPELLSTDSSPTALAQTAPTSSALPRPLGLTSYAQQDTSQDIHLGAVFPMTDFNEYHKIFTRTLERINADPSTTLTFTNVSIPTMSSVHFRLKYVCLAMQALNISSLLVIGNQDMLNTMSVISRYSGIPVLGYNTNHTPSAIRGERPLYLQLDPSSTLQAKAIVHTLKASHWYCVSIITEESYANDGFIDAFRKLTSQDPRWRVEDTIVLPKGRGTSLVDSALLNLFENQSRIILLHCSVRVARKVFQVAEQQKLTDKGYAWFVTKDVVVKTARILQDYPVGLLGVVLDKKYNQKSMIADATGLVAKATERFVKDYGRDSFKRSCMEFRYPEDDTVDKGLLLYRYLKNSTYYGNNTISFNEDGVLDDAGFRIVNLVGRTEDNNGETKKRWKQVGYYNNGSVKVSTILWPGGNIAGPSDIGDRVLRVVTNIVEPFVMEQVAVNEKCISAVSCLTVQTKDKDTLDDIFRDFANNVHNDSRPYEVRCCQGLAINLLQQLGLDLNFTFQLYVTSDRSYGHMNNGTWNGMVQDLLKEASHMAVAAFSITRSRSRVIDFTDPYFFSGFSILVSERKRNPPIYAFMEPFDGWVWISIVVSATVVAVALSLLEWNSPFGLNPWGRKRKTNYTLGSGLNMVYAILFQHTIKTKSPKAWPSKWLQNYWAGASIFIYSSYTANLAAFLAGKNSGVMIDGIHDPKLLEPGRPIGVLDGNAVEDYIRQVNPYLLQKAQRFPSTLPLLSAVELLKNASIDAYLDDTPVLEYARSRMDVLCKLRLVGKGFGEDAYGIALPKNSWLKEMLSQKIREYHENGFIDDLHDLYFRRSRCFDEVDDNQLQGEASRMDFKQHAGLYLLLVVGIVVCILLMFMEHGLFKWLVPYWRRKPPKSFWRSMSMLFWSQRLHRIITSEELVSPHHSAREMIEVVKNRDFTKLFQKSVKKQEKNLFRSSKNLFRVVEQLQLKTRRDERLSQNPSTQTDCSMDSDNSYQPINPGPWNPRSVAALPSPKSDEPGTSDTNDDNRIDPICRPKNPCAKKCDLQIKKNKPSLKEAHASSTFSAPVTYVDKSTAESVSDNVDAARSDDELLQSSDTDTVGPLQRVGSSKSSDRNPYKLLEIAKPTSNSHCDITVDIESERKSPNSNFPLLGRASSSEDNLTSSTGCRESGTDLVLPNGMVILAPNGDLLTRSASVGKNIFMRPKTFGKTISPNLPETLKSLPQKENRVKSTLARKGQARENLNGGKQNVNNTVKKVNLDHLTKEDLFLMWKTSESELSRKLKQALSEKASLEEKLLESKSNLDT